MSAKIFFALCLLSCVPAWSQVAASNPANPEADKGPEQATQLQIPPPVSGQAYPTTFAGDAPANFLRGGITFTSAYSSNVAWGPTPVSDMSYSLWPTLALDRTTERMHLALDYAPGFTLYQHTSSLNQSDQYFNGSVQYRLSPNLTGMVTEGFQKTSNIFNQPNPVSVIAVGGGVPASNVALIAPAANTLNNTSTAQLTYQVGANSMFGGSGTYSTLSYAEPTNAAYLYDSRVAGGSFFYASRFREKNYYGISYQYQNFLSFQTAAPSTATQTQTVFLFVTAYLKPNFSVSLSGGPQYYNSTQASSPAASAWQPMGMISANWQGERTNLAVSYSRLISGAGGLNGAFQTNNVNSTFYWQASRNWTASASGAYSNYLNLTPSFLFSSPGGHTISTAASLQRNIGQNSNVQVGYSWTHQAYPQTSGITILPNVNRVFVTLNFTFSKPLQR